MNYEDAVTFHEDAKRYGSVLGLTSIRALMRELGDVWKELNIVHIAGTNGKGSVLSFLASALREAGYLVGSYSSPAVFGLREPYQAGGQWISREEYASCMGEVAAACEKMTGRGLSHPTVFEIETALAFLWFFRKGCAIVLLEVGMGGGTDATNLIERPLCSVFTSIGMDHMEFLGDSMEAIAAVKAGILKTGVPAVTIGQPPKADAVLREEARKKLAPYCVAEPMDAFYAKGGKLYCEHPRYGTLSLAMAASYQAKNAALAIRVLEVLRELGYPFTDGQLIRGMEAATWAGRFECIGESRLFYVDGAHNMDGIYALADSLRLHFPGWRRIGIMGVMADKPYEEMIAASLPLFEQIYAVTPDNPRALPAQALAAERRRQGGEAEAMESVEAAVARACADAAKEEGVMAVAFGSLYSLREVRRAFDKITGNRR